MKPPSVNPVADSRAAEALALVQTHRAQGYPTILQAMTEHVRSMSERNQVARLGEWREQELGGGLRPGAGLLWGDRGGGEWLAAGGTFAGGLPFERGKADAVPSEGVEPHED